MNSRRLRRRLGPRQIARLNPSGDEIEIEVRFTGSGRGERNFRVAPKRELIGSVRGDVCGTEGEALVRGNGKLRRSPERGRGR